MMAFWGSFPCPTFVQPPTHLKHPPKHDPFHSRKWLPGESHVPATRHYTQGRGMTNHKDSWSHNEHMHTHRILLHLVLRCRMVFRGFGIADGYGLGRAYFSTKRRRDQI